MFSARPVPPPLEVPMCEFIAGGLAGCALTMMILAPIVQRDRDEFEQEIRNEYRQDGIADGGAADRHRPGDRGLGGVG